MAILRKWDQLILFATMFTISLSIATSDSNSDLVSELLSLESQSPSGIIRLNDQLVSRFLTSTRAPRPYSILIFFDAHQLHNKPELHLQDLRQEVSLVATSFIRNNKDDPSGSLEKLFFCELEFKESQSSFALFGVNSLPHIRLVTPDVKSMKDDSIQMEQGDASRLAESVVDFLQSRIKVTVGPIHRPPILSKTQIGLIVTVFLICLPFAIKKIIAGETILHDRKIWLAGAVFVYFFSVSGAMHNIIRKMPMFLADRNDPNKVIFFYQGSGMQLGAEGFAIGFLYTIVGLLLAFVTNALVRVRNVTVQRVLLVISLLVSFWAVKEVIYLDNWKTGYGVHGYWPSSWN